MQDIYNTVFIYLEIYFNVLGILQREQENSVVYGSIDGGKTLSGNEKFLELVGSLGLNLFTSYTLR